MSSKDILKDYFIKMWQLDEELTRRGVSPQEEYNSMIFDNMSKFKDHFQEEARLGFYGKFKVEDPNELISLVQQGIQQRKDNMQLKGSIRQDTPTVITVHQHEPSTDQLPKRVGNISGNRTQGINVDRQEGYRHPNIPKEESFLNDFARYVIDEFLGEEEEN